MSHETPPYALGFCYKHGEGVPKDNVRAAIWYRKAAEQGFAIAQQNLGVDYYNGQGVPQNDIEAYKWFSLAAAQGDETTAKSRDLLTCITVIRLRAIEVVRTCS